MDALRSDFCPRCTGWIAVFAATWRPVGEVILAFELAPSGQIAHQWVTGEVRG